MGDVVLIYIFCRILIFKALFLIYIAPVAPDGSNKHEDRFVFLFFFLPLEMPDQNTPAILLGMLSGYMDRLARREKRKKKKLIIFKFIYLKIPPHLTLSHKGRGDKWEGD